MPTLQNIRGASLAPDFSQALGILFSQKQTRDKLELEETKRGAIQEQIGALIGGAEIPQQPTQPGQGGPDPIQFTPAATGKAREKALLRLISLDPAIGRSVSSLLQSGDVRATEELRAQAVKGLRQASFVSGQKDFPSKQRALTSLGEQAIANGEPLDRIIKLQNLSEPELDLELERMKIMGQDLKTITGTTEQFEPVLDAEGNVIAQKSTKTGKVISDPRVGAAPTPSTTIGKARQDLKSGFITLDDFNTIKSTPKKFQTEVGKSIADKQLAIEIFGEGSEQVNAINEAIKSDQKGEKPKLSDVAGIRKEFTKLSGDFIKLKSSIGKIRQAEGDPSAAGDIAMIFSFMKMLDPGSVVREGEFATAANAAGVPERIRGQFNRILSGERLTPAQRTDFIKTADGIFETQLNTQRELEKNFRGLAGRQNIDPADVVIDFIGGGDVAAPTEQAPTTAQVTNQPEAQAPTPTLVQEGATATNPSTGQKLIFRGGQWQTL